MAQPVVHDDFGGIPGLTYITNFISPQEEKKIIRFLDQSGKWVVEFGSRQVQQYGYIYDFFTEALTPTDDVPKALWGVTKRMQNRGIMDVVECQQIIVNEYTGKKQGIGKHVDCDVFGPTISTLTLSDPCVMVMYETKLPEGVTDYNFKILEETGKTVSVLLKRRSLLVLKGESRYYWKHGIPKAESVELPDGDLFEKDDSYRRVSVSFRSVVPGKTCTTCSTDNPSVSIPVY